MRADTIICIGKAASGLAATILNGKDQQIHLSNDGSTILIIITNYEARVGISQRSGKFLLPNMGYFQLMQFLSKITDQDCPEKLHRAFAAKAKQDGTRLESGTLIDAMGWVMPELV